MTFRSSTLRPSRVRLSAVATLVLILSSTASFAQESDVPPAGSGEPAFEDDCRALLEQRDGDTGDAPEDLSERLARCDGVLAPPPVGDPGMVTPPPDTGTTPVIPPEATPEQTPG